MTIKNLTKLNKTKGGVEIMQKLRLNLNQKGFTLIELLIVIVIIAILAGVVIGVLNPVQQQNRARDGVIRSNMSKMVLAGKSLQVSSARANKAPTHAEFISAIGNVAATDCTSTADGTAGTCTFAINGILLPSTCGAANTYNGDAAGQCRFAFYRGPAATPMSTFRLATKSFSGANAVLFVYQYVETAQGANEGFFSCPNSYVITADPLTAAGCAALD
jgi:type IV pilus assembly protein PilA